MLVCLFFFMDFLEILNQIIDMCNIKEFPNNVRWFNVSNRLDVFLNCFIEIILLFMKNKNQVQVNFKMFEWKVFTFA